MAKSEPNPVEGDPGRGPAPEGQTSKRRTVAIPRGTGILLALAGATVTAIGLHAISSIAAPVLLSLILVICVQPVRIALEKRGVARGLASGAVIIATFALLLGFIALLIVSFGQFLLILPQFSDQIAAIGQSIGDFFQSIGFGAQQVDEIVASLSPSSFVAIASSILGGVGDAVFWLVVVLTTMLLMAMDGSFIPSLLRKIEPVRPTMVTAIVGFGSGVRRYMVVTTALGAAQGVFNWIALTALGVPGAALWGVLSFLCSFIPNIGYFIAIIPPLVFGALVGGWPTVVAIIIIYGGINAIVQSVIQPRVVGHAVLLNQTLTFVSVLFWAVVFGPIGALLAVPLTLLVRTILLDADPGARWWRPFTGDVGEVTGEMKTEDLERKQERKARKADPAKKSKPPKKSTPPAKT